MMLLTRRGGIVSYCDPYVSAVKLGWLDLNCVAIETAFTADCVVIVTDHRAFDYQLY